VEKSPGSLFEVPQLKASLKAGLSSAEENILSLFQDLSNSCTAVQTNLSGASSLLCSDLFGVLVTSVNPLYFNTASP
jgi:hypothetical protein